MVQANLFDKWGQVSLQRLKAADLQRILNRKWFPSRLLALAVYYWSESGSCPMSLLVKMFKFIMSYFSQMSVVLLTHTRLMKQLILEFICLFFFTTGQWKILWKQVQLKNSFMDNKWQPWGMFKKMNFYDLKLGFLRSAAIIFRQEFSDSNPYIHRPHKHTAASFLQAI